MSLDRDPDITQTQVVNFILSRSTKIPGSNFNLVLACAKYMNDERTLDRDPALTVSFLFFYALVCPLNVYLILF